MVWKKAANAAEAEAQRMTQLVEVEDRVDFYGPYTQLEAPELFGSAHLLLHTKYNDPCPRLVVEAMSCGLPVAYSATGGVPELVGPEAGVGVPGPEDWEKDHPPDPEMLAEAVMEILSRREGYAEAARKRAVERFDVASWLKRHGEVFENLQAEG
jgi:glycosyltransferase involved in cell wall biosynthesis